MHLEDDGQFDMVRSSMSLKIDQDYGRFRNIVCGKIREGLRQYISRDDMIGRRGRIWPGLRSDGRGEPAPGMRR
jgi:hypothetical protein